PILIEHLLNDGSARVRALCAIRMCDFQDEQAALALIQALSDSDEAVPRQAIIALGNQGDPRAIPHLLRFLRYPGWRTRYYTARTLIELRSTDPHLVDALEQLAREPEAEEHDLQAEEQNC